MSQPTPDERAADWLIRRDRGLTPGEQDDYLQWLAADPRHGDALARQQATWRELDLLADWRPEHAPEPNPALLAPPRHATRRPLRWLALGALAAAACVALAFFLNRETQPTASLASATPTVATGYEKRLLDDGSVLELNRGASVSVVYTPTERRVRLLSGEVHFTVAKNPARPFIVSAAGVETRAVGTAFNVHLQSAAVDVLVTEGVVQLKSSTEATPAYAPVAREPIPLLSPGQRAVVSLAPVSSATSVVVTTASPEEISRTLAWQAPLLRLGGQTLAELAVEFERRSGQRVILADPALASLRVGGRFRADDLEGFTHLLATTLDLEIDHAADGTLVLRKKKSGNR